MKIKIFYFSKFMIIMSIGMNFYDQISAQNNSIIGTWISETDYSRILVFKSDGKCYDYSEGVLIETDLYDISNSSPKCGFNVNISINTNYLQLIDINEVDTFCYEINGITEKYLSLRPLGEGGLSLYLRELRINCDPSSSNYNPVNCDFNSCSSASPNYNADSCAISRCNPVSPNYDAIYSQQVCNLAQANYNCIACQHQSITDGTQQYKPFLKTFFAYLQQNQPLQAANYFINNYGFYLLYGIPYTITYNPSFTGLVKLTGTYGSAMQFEIGEGFNMGVYLNSLCSEIQLNINKAINLYYGSYNIGQNYGDFQVYSNTIMQCASNFEPSPYRINAYYNKMMTAYYYLTPSQQANLKSTYDLVNQYWNYNIVNLAIPINKCQ